MHWETICVLVLLTRVPRRLTTSNTVVNMSENFLKVCRYWSVPGYIVCVCVCVCVCVHARTRPCVLYSHLGGPGVAIVAVVGDGIGLCRID
jgi:hypothetical protein